MGALESRKATPPTPPSPPANNPIETESETWSTTDPLDSIILHTSEVGNFDLASTIARLQRFLNAS